MTQEDRKMAKEQDGDQVRGEVSPGGTKGGRRPTGVPSGQGVVGPLTQGQRWSAARKREVVLRIFRGESLKLLSRELGVELYRLEWWADHHRLCEPDTAPWPGAHSGSWRAFRRASASQKINQS